MRKNTRDARGQWSCGEGLEPSSWTISWWIKVANLMEELIGVYSVPNLNIWSAISLILGVFFFLVSNLFQGCVMRGGRWATAKVHSIVSIKRMIDVSIKILFHIHRMVRVIPFHIAIAVNCRHWSLSGKECDKLNVNSVLKSVINYSHLIGF